MRYVLTTATASTVNISAAVIAVRYDMFVKMYTTVTNKTAKIFALGKFLKLK